MSISIVTLNTWKCDGNYINRIPLIADELKNVAPHLIACQEVFHTVDNTISTKNYFEKELGMKAYFFPSRKKERILNDSELISFSGLCIFTNLEVEHYQELFLPTHLLDGDRTAQLLAVKLSNYKIAIVNTHLTHLDEPKIRKKQLEFILESVSSDDYDAFFLCGDFNDTPNSEIVQFLTNEENTFVSTFDATHTTHISNKCIDYIFYKSKLNIEVSDQKIILNKPINNIIPSDHFGLYASYKINKNE